MPFQQKGLVAQADGIVVLTGGKSRINEGVRLLAAGKAKRLLISGVHAQTSVRQLSRLVPGAGPLFNCCIDLGARRPRHDRQCARKPLMGAPKGLPFPDYCHKRLSYAPFHGRISQRHAPYKACSFCH